MSGLEQAVATSTAVLQRLDVNFALVGGLAVGAWTEPRFTQDFDFAVSVSDDHEAEGLIRSLHHLNFSLVAMVEQDAVGRLATARLSHRSSGFIMDLLFASSGIEPEIAARARPLQIPGGLVLPVALPGHLIAMKVLSNDPLRRPQDGLDLANLLKVADLEQIALARASVRSIMDRGFDRGKSLEQDLECLLNLRT